MSVTVFKMSQISMTMLEGTVVKWLKKEGDKVNKDEPLLEVQTDKVVTEVTSPADGYIRKLLANEGDDVPVGGDLCIIADEDDKVEVDIPKTEISKPETVVQDDNKCSNVGPIDKVRISPLAKKIALDNGIDYKNIKGLGPNGLIKKQDIISAMQKEKQADNNANKISTNEVNTNEEYDVVPFSGIRKVTAEQMMRSKQQTASLTTFAEVNMDKVKEMRKILPISYTSFVVQAVSKALKDFSIINSTLCENEIRVLKSININVAVGTGKTLVTPVVKNAGNKNILTISDEIKDLANRARNNELTVDDFQGGTFTVTNSGVFGSLIFTPIINYPQCAILGIGKLIKMPVVIDDQITIANMMHLCLTYDHRIVDGETSVKFLQKVKYYLENPNELI